MKKLIYYENGSRVIWDGRADVSYHQAKIIKETDLTNATDEEIQRLYKNPNDEALISTIQMRKKVVA